MLLNVVHLKIRVEYGNTMLNRFWVMLELSAQAADEINVAFTRIAVECLRVVKLAERLTLHKSLQDIVHGNFGLESLISCTQSKNTVVGDRLAKIFLQTTLSVGIDETCSIDK